MTRRRPRPIEVQIDFGFQTISHARCGETDAVYMSVLLLRTEGCRVLRAGPNKHLVDGKVISTRQLISQAGMGYLKEREKAWASSSTSAEQPASASNGAGGRSRE